MHPGSCPHPQLTLRHGVGVAVGSPGSAEAMGRSGVNWSADGGLVHVVCFPGRVQGQNLGN